MNLWVYTMMGEILEQIERMVLIGLFACLALCLACVGISVCCIKVRSRWQRQRAEHSFRADVARGLAETEQFLQIWDTWTLREEPRDSGNDDVG